MRTSPSTSTPRLARRLVLFLLALPLVAALFGPPAAPAAADAVTFTLHKTVSPTGTVQSGVTFTYDLEFSWGATAAPTLVVSDTLPPGIEPAAPTMPYGSDPLTTSTIVVTGGQTTVTFLVPVSNPSGGVGHCYIPARFIPGAVCGGPSVCNEIAFIAVKGQEATTKHVLDVVPGVPPPCLTPADPVDRWTFSAAQQSGCACDQDVTYELKITSPPGNDIGGLNLVNPVVTFSLPPPALVHNVVRTANWPFQSTWNPANQVPTSQVTQTSASSISIALNTTTLTVRDGWTYMMFVTARFPCSAYTAPIATPPPTVTIGYQTACGPRAPVIVPSTGFDICREVQKASIHKSLHVNPDYPAPTAQPCLCPGCCAYYRIGYGNGGTVPLVNPVFWDDLPLGLDVSEVRTEVGSFSQVVVETFEAPATGTALATSPSWTKTVTSPSIDGVAASLGKRIGRVRWSYTGTLAVGDSIVAWVKVCNTGAPAGSTVVNHASGTALPGDVQLETLIGPCGPRFVAKKDFLGATCGDTHFNGSYPTGTVVRFRMSVANIGPVAATPFTIQDVLPPGVQYVPGNDTWCFFHGFIPANSHHHPGCTDMSSAVPLPIGGPTPITPTVTPWSPTVSQTVQWTIPTLPGRCDSDVDALVLEFDARLDTSMATGTYRNKFQGSGGGASTNWLEAEFQVRGAPQWQLEKWIRVKPSATWTKSATAAPGAQLEYLFELKNTSAVAITNLCILDLMPHATDTFVLPIPINGTAADYQPRGSTYDIPVAPGAPVSVRVVTGSPSAGTAVAVSTLPYTSVSATPDKDPQRSATCVGSCGTSIADPSGATIATWAQQSASGVPAGTFGLQISGGTTVLAPGETLEVIVPATVPSGVHGSACNNVAASATPVGSSAPCGVAQTIDLVCVDVSGAPTPCLTIAKSEIVCAGNGTYTWTFQLTNHSLFPASSVFFQGAPPATFTVTSASPAFPLAPGATTAVTVTIANAATLAGTRVCFLVGLGQHVPAPCRVDHCIDLPRCPTSGGCGDPECRTGSVVLSTGTFGGTVLPGPYVKPDPHWVLVDSPNTSLTLNAPAWVIDPNGAWSTLPGSAWISAYPTDLLNLNNPSPDKAYELRRCFCVCEGARALAFDLRMYCDNIAEVTLVAPDGSSTPLGSQTSTTTSSFHVPLVMNVVVPTPLPGRYCVLVKLRNLSSTAMGLDIAGTVSTLPVGSKGLVSDACCDATGRILGLKFNDKGCDGMVDSTDPALAGFTFVAKDTATGATYTSTVSDALGVFSFPPLPAGTYVVTENPLSPWDLTSPAGGSQTVTVTAGGVAQVTFSNCNICETLFQDLGQRECCGFGVALKPIAGWGIASVQYQVAGGATMQSIQATSCPFTTNPANPAGSTVGMLAFGSPCTQSTTVGMTVASGGEGCTVCVDLVATLVRRGEVRVERRTCSHHVCFSCCKKSEPCNGMLCVFKFEDRNGDGRPVGEPGLPDWVFLVSGANGGASLNTDEAGRACYSLPPGTYTVAEQQKPLWDSTTGLIKTVTVVAGKVTEVRFGNRRRKVDPNEGHEEGGGTGGTTVDGGGMQGDDPLVGRLCVHKFLDRNGNGVQDEGETPLAGWSFIVTDSSGQTFTLATDEKGVACREVRIGRVSVAEQPRRGWRTTTANPQKALVLPSRSGRVAEVTFGNQPISDTGDDHGAGNGTAGGGTGDGSATDVKPGRICVRKFLDRNGNGVLDAEETPLAGFSFIVTDARGQRFTLTTDREGRACREAEAGACSVLELPRKGWTVTTPNPQRALVVAGGQVEVLFGNQPQRGALPVDPREPGAPVPTPVPGPIPPPMPVPADPRAPQAPVPGQGRMMLDGVERSGQLATLRVVGADGRPIDLSPTAVLRIGRTQVPMSSITLIRIRWLDARPDAGAELSLVKADGQPVAHPFGLLEGVELLWRTDKDPIAWSWTKPSSDPRANEKEARPRRRPIEIVYVPIIK